MQSHGSESDVGIGMVILFVLFSVAGATWMFIKGGTTDAGIGFAVAMASASLAIFAAHRFELSVGHAG